MDLSSYFEIKERGTDLKTEIISGITTFLWRFLQGSNIRFDIDLDEE